MHVTVPLYRLPGRSVPTAPDVCILAAEPIRGFPNSSRGVCRCGRSAPTGRNPRARAAWQWCQLQPRIEPECWSVEMWGRRKQRPTSTSRRYPRPSPSSSSPQRCQIFPLARILYRLRLPLLRQPSSFSFPLRLYRRRFFSIDPCFLRCFLCRKVLQQVSSNRCTRCRRGNLTSSAPVQFGFMIRL